MRNVFFSLLMIFSVGLYAQNYDLQSPDKTIAIKVYLEHGQAYYKVFKNGEQLLEASSLGLVLKEANLTEGLILSKVSAVKAVKEQYQLLNGKREHNVYQANEKIFTFTNKQQVALEVVFRLSNDGVAFQYHIPQIQGFKTVAVLQESSSFNFFNDAKAWLQPMSVAKTGWEKTNPSYEEYYQKEIPVATPSTLGTGWVYPALFKYKKYWFSVTEAGLDTNYCATRLSHLSPQGNYSVTFPDEREKFTGKNVYPISSLPLTTPWRIISLGSLKNLVESSLGTDLAKPAVKKNFDFVKPGVASWSWVLLKDDSTVYHVQKQFIDYASAMKWAYCLIDADWDRKIGYDKIAELAAYAKTKDVGLILWYNSAGDWNTVKYSPKDKLLNREVRRAEFSRLQQMGIKGVKVDFFGGDGQSMIKYYFDIFADAADYGLSVNCHGATLPRGWQRTWPNLMTMESIKGMEFITFEQVNANEEPYHATTIPFTRNLFDPMDFTPMSLYKIPNIKRVTTSAFELATTVVFQSGIQHLAETPKGMAQMPSYVIDFLKSLPATFIDTKFIDGYPGKFVVMARKVKDKWLIAGLNAGDDDLLKTIDLSFIKGKNMRLITDGSTSLFEEKQLKFSKFYDIKIKPKGGFILEIKL